jgi:hypothetical protein
MDALVLKRQSSLEHADEITIDATESPAVTLLATPTTGRAVPSRSIITPS